MVAYNFQPHFAPLIQRGEKTQTIRRNRRRHARPGEPVQLYTGLRTRQAAKILEPDAICTCATYCALRRDSITLGTEPPIEFDAFARADGFKDYADMLAWFDRMHGLPFTGILIKWKRGDA